MEVFAPLESSIKGVIDVKIRDAGSKQREGKGWDGQREVRVQEGTEALYCPQSIPMLIMMMMMAMMMMMMMIIIIIIIVVVGVGRGEGGAEEEEK